MFKRLRTLLLPLLTLLLFAACQPNTTPGSEPTGVAFPTMTAGRVIEAPLSPGLSVALDGGLANPATAIARANQPTPTPNTAACPAADETVTLVTAVPGNARQMEEAIVRYLSGGGSVAGLERTLREDWNVLGEFGVVRGDVDLTGEGTPEVIITYNTPDEGGVLLIEGCVDGRYLTRYQAALGGNTPQLLNIGDMNFNGIPEVLFTSQDCTAECVYLTQLATWNIERARFVNLLSGAISSDQVPTIEDIDRDQVSEIIVRFDDSGNAQTGPLRTGYSAYDWNGTGYVESVRQLNPPRFLIQLIQLADTAFAAQNMEEAISLYNLSLTSGGLENWYNNDRDILTAYALYRLLLAYAFTEDDRLLGTQQTILTNYADVAAAPPYAQLALDFWNALQVTNNLRAACLRVQETVLARPEALTLLNRYGSRSPTYTAADLCPF